MSLKRILSVTMAPEAANGKQGIGGAETVNYHLARHFAARGVEMTTVTNGAPERLTGDVVSMPGPVHHLSYSGLSYLRLARRISDLVFESGAELVLTHGPIPLDLAAAVGAKGSKVPSVIYRHIGINSLGLTGVKDIFYRAMDRWATGYTDGMIFLTEEARAANPNYDGRRDAISAVVPNGIDLAHFTEAKRPSGRKTLGIVAQMVDHKGWVDLLHVTARLRDQDPDVSLLAVGDGPCRADYEALADTLGLSGAVRFVGNTNDVRPHLADMDVFVLPSRREGLSMACIEAMASGLPLVLTPVDGASTLVAESETGMIVPIGDRASLAGALDDLLHDEARRKAFGRAGRKRAEAMFSSKIMAQSVLKHLRKIAAQ